MSFFSFFHKEQENFIFLCFGNVDRSDDGLGLLIAKSLKEKFPDKVISEDEIDITSYLLEIIDNTAIEVVIIIDAIDFGAQPGTLLITSRIDKAVRQISSHQLPFQQIVKILTDNNKEVVLCGIQIKTTEFMGKMSDEVLEGIRNLLSYFVD